MGMELGMQEMPLALFSTLAPMGAGAFALLAVAFFVRSFDDDVLKKIDRVTVIPLVFVVAGFICAFFHLASPQNALGVFANIGSSPMSNEILVGVISTVVAVVYWIVAMATKMSPGLRRGLSAVVAVMGLVFCLFVGLAYGMPTIPSWDNAMVPLSTLGFGLLGGAAVGVATLSCAGVDMADKSFSGGTMALTCVGVVLAVACFGIQMGMVSGMVNNTMVGADLVGGLMGWIACAIVLMIAAAALVIVAVRRGRGAAGLAWLSVVVAFAGILVARLVFYGVEFSVGLAL